MNHDTDAFQSGGDSLPVAKFPNVGDSITGQIIDARQRQDRDIDGNLQTWDNGDPKMVWIFDLDTTGTGEADTSLYVKGNLYTVARQALRDAGIPTVGAVIKVTHSAVGEPKKKGYNPPKLYTVAAKAGPPIKPPVDPFAGEPATVGAPAAADDFGPF